MTDRRYYTIRSYTLLRESLPIFHWRRNIEYISRYWQRVKLIWKNICNAYGLLSSCELWFFSRTLKESRSFASQIIVIKVYDPKANDIASAHSERKYQTVSWHTDYQNLNIQSFRFVSLALDVKKHEMESKDRSYHLQDVYTDLHWQDYCASENIRKNTFPN